MKQIYRQFLKIFSLLSVGMFLLVSAIFYLQATESAHARLEQILASSISRYEREHSNFQDKLELIKEDYLNRATTIGYILEHFTTADGAQDGAEVIESLQAIMELKKINLIDENGEIIMSDNPQGIGVNLADVGRASELYRMVKGELESPLISVGERSDQGSGEVTGRDYVAVRLEESGNVVQITFDSENVDEARRSTEIGSVVHYFITPYDTTLFVVDFEGKLLGVTDGSRGGEALSGVQVNQQMLDLFENSQEGRVRFQDGHMGYLLTTVTDEFILAAFYDMSTEVSTFVQTMLVLAAMFVGTFAIAMLLLKHLFRVHLVDDFNRMEEDIEAFMEGDVEREIRPCTNPELEHLNDAVRMMKEEYRHKSERLNRIIGGLNSNVGAFECLDYTNYTFISDNLQRLLELSDEEMHHFQKGGGEFARFMAVLDEQKGEEDTLFYRGRWLKITTYRLEHEYFGLVTDRTEEYMERERNLRDLRDAETRAQRDSLTGLYSRAAFEQMVTAQLEGDGANGVLLMMDLDNFKHINDTLGHPEGDRALQKMADCLREEFRQSDVIGRLGGDEFVVFLPNHVPVDRLESKLSAFLPAMRRAMSCYERFQVTVSVGAAYAGGALRSYTALYQGADTALYIAKNLGKNRFYVNTDDICCMEKVCLHCREQCARRDILHLE